MIGPEFMTPEEALRLAKYQLPGDRHVVGPTMAVRLPIRALPHQRSHAETKHLPGDYTWRRFEKRRKAKEAYND